MTEQKAIVITEPMDLSLEQKARLAALGPVVAHDDKPSRDEWLERTRGFPVVCSGKCGLNERIDGEIGTEGVYSLDKDTFVSHPLTSTAWIDAERIKKAGITVSYAPGANRVAVAEWAMIMMLRMVRDLSQEVGRSERDLPLQRTDSLEGMNIAILGRGNVGTAIGERADTFDMNVSYLLRGGSLVDVVRGADIVVNSLSSKPENHGMLGPEFFLESMPEGARFVSMTNPAIYDLDAMVKAISQGRLRQAAIDIGDRLPGDVTHPNYRRLADLHDPRIFVTAQVAHFTKRSALRSYDMMIGNIEAMQRGQPTNLVR